MTILSGWDNFLEIMGSAAAALTGLTFIVITLSAQAGRVNLVGLRTFITPTIVHFSTVLGMVAFLSMPHQTGLSLAMIFVTVGVLGLVYIGITARHLRRITGTYIPDREDWIWNVLLPGIAYGGFLTAGVLVDALPQDSMKGVAVALLLLIFIGIHNAWDIAVWHSIRKEPAERS